MSQRCLTALEYAARGWRVFPVSPNSKRPRFRKGHKWGDGFKSATTDPATILEMWGEGGMDCNIGIATGKASGLFVIDVDVKDGAVGGESERALLDELGMTAWPVTPKALTATGGWHVYFEYPEDEDLTSGRSPLGPNLDTRGEGGYVVAPGSTVDGNDVTWLEMVGQPAPLPVGVIERLRIQAETKSRVKVEGSRPKDVDDDTVILYNREAAMDALDTMIGKVRDAPDGTKHDTCYMAGLVMGSWDHDGIIPDSEAVVLALLDAVRDRAKDVRAAERTIRDGMAVGRENEKWAPARPFELFSIPDDERVIIVTNGRQDAEIYKEIRDAIVSMNAPNPILFNHGSELTTVEYKRLVHLKQASMGIVAGDFCKFMRINKASGDLTDTHAPTQPMMHLHAVGAPRFPPIIRVASAPFFTASGRYVSEPGYNPESKTYYFGTDDILAPPLQPAMHEIEAASSFILDEMLGDFHFTSDGDRATCLAMMLQPLVRAMIDGPTPLYSIEASTPGTGKSLLAQVALAPTVGSNRLTMSAPATEEDWRKELLASLMSAPEAIVIDNVKDAVTSAAFCFALTEPEYTQRILGVSSTATIPVRCVWAMTANNPSFSVDMARRMVRISLESEGSHPEMRDGFRHENLDVWVRQHRDVLLHALSTLVAGWVAAGRPRGKQIMGRYEEWAQIMGGLTEFTGAPGFLSHRDETADSEEHVAWRYFVARWAQSPQSQQGMRVAQLRALAQDTELSLDIKGNTSQAWDTSFGYMLRQMRGRTFCGFKIEKINGTHHSLWRLRPQGAHFGG